MNLRTINRTRAVVGITVAATALSLLPAGMAQAQTKAPIKIPFIGELSGAAAVAGRNARSGAITAVKQINDAGGINGRPLELVVYDTQTSPGVAAQLIRQALADNPPVVTGFNASTVLSPSVPVLAAAKIPWMTSGSLFPAIQELGFFFSTSPDNTGGAVADVIALKQAMGGSLKGKRVGITAQSNSPVYDERLQVIRSQVKKAGGTVGLVLRDSISLSSWTSQAARMLDTTPDAMLVLNNDTVDTVVAKALLVAGFAGPIIADGSAASDAMLSNVNSPSFWSIRDGSVPNPGTPLYQLVAAAKASTTVARSAPFFARSYAATIAIAQTLRKCGLPCPSAKFVSTVKGLGKVNVPMNPLFGPLDFSKNLSGVNFAQLWQWDSTAKTPVARSQVFPTL